MELKGFMYELARRSDSEDLRKLGGDFLAALWSRGDPALVVGFLLQDWMEQVRANSLDAPQERLLESLAPGRWGVQ